MLCVVRGVPLPTAAKILRFQLDQNEMQSIHLHTVGDFLAGHHTLGLYCRHCDRWTEAPLERLAREGWARTPIRRLRFRCGRCGGPGQHQVRPPAAPGPHPTLGWINPPKLVSATAFHRRHEPPR